MTIGDYSGHKNNIFWTVQQNGFGFRYIRNGPKQWKPYVRYFHFIKTLIRI